MAQRSHRIVRDDDVLGGEPRVRGRRVGVRRIHALVDGRDLPPAEIAQKFDLSVEDVEAALEYYENNPELVAELEARQRERERRAAAAGMTDVSEYRPDD